MSALYILSCITVEEKCRIGGRKKKKGKQEQFEDHYKGDFLIKTSFIAMVPNK